MILHIIVLSCLLASCGGELEDGISYVVQAGKTDCFYRDIDVGTKMDFDLQVLSGGVLDISVVIKSPSGKELLNKQQEAEINEEVTAEEKGPHEICFDNSFSMMYDKVVYFDLGISDFDSGHEEITKSFSLPKDVYENVDKIWKSLDLIGTHFEAMSDMQMKYRSVYRRHEYIQSSNLSRVTWFSLISSSLMILIGILQVYLIKNLFKN